MNNKVSGKMLDEERHQHAAGGVEVGNSRQAYIRAAADAVKYA